MAVDLDMETGHAYLDEVMDMITTYRGVCGRCGQRLEILPKGSFVEHVCIGVPFSSDAAYRRWGVEVGIFREGKAPRVVEWRPA